MNDIKILGRLTAAPELKLSQNKRCYTWFTVAVPRKNNKNKADFVRCVAFDKLAESLAQHCEKGRQVLVNGRLEVSRKVDPQSQQAQIYYAIMAETIEFLQHPQTAGSQNKSAVADHNVAPGA